MEQL
jgi:hypothetical protein